MENPIIAGEDLCFKLSIWVINSDAAGCLTTERDVFCVRSVVSTSIISANSKVAKSHPASLTFIILSLAGKDVRQWKIS